RIFPQQSNQEISAINAIVGGPMSISMNNTSVGQHLQTAPHISLIFIIIFMRIRTKCSHIPKFLMRKNSWYFYKVSLNKPSSRDGQASAKIKGSCFTILFSKKKTGN